MIRLIICSYLLSTTALLGANGICQGNHPSFSRDGKQVLYESHGKIYTIGLKSNEAQLVCDFAEASNPKWSPDGNRIIFEGVQKKNQIIESSIWIMKRDKTSPVQLFRSTKEINRNPCFSRDGTKIAWCRGNQIWIADVNGENAHPLRDIVPMGKVYFQDWSPDGKTLMFLTIADTLRSKLWFCDTNGQHLRPLAVEMYILSARWLNDTSHVALLTTYGVIKLSINEVFDQFLLYSCFSIGSYDFSRDNKFIVYEMQDPEYDSTIMLDKLDSSSK